MFICAFLLISLCLPFIHPSIYPFLLSLSSFIHSSFVRSFFHDWSIHPSAHSYINTFIYLFYLFIRSCNHSPSILSWLSNDFFPPPPHPLTPYQRQTSSTSTCKGAVLSGDELLHQNKDTTYLLGRGRFRSPALSDSQVCMAIGVDQ